MKNTSISERLSQIIDYLNITINDFAKKLGYSRSQALYDMVNGKSKPSFDFFEKLLNSEYSEIFSLEWIILGIGGMLKNNDGLHIITEPKTEYGKSSELIEVKNEMIDILKQQNKELQIDKEFYRDLLKSKFINT